MVKDLIITMRLKHWVKNLFVFIPLLVSGSFFDVNLLLDSFLVFICFCFASSSVYFFNDLIDIRKDRNHPKKRFRPIASGKISLITAIIFTLFLLFSTLYFQSLSSSSFYVIIILYLFLNFNYSIWLKKISIIDIISISAGFVLRVQAGVLATGLDTSIWLISMTFTLAMLLALGKRKVELKNSKSNESRVSLKGYSKTIISDMQNIFISCTIIFYILYVNLNTTFGGNKLYLYVSVIFVVAGLLRYVQLNSLEILDEEPTDILFKDKFIMIYVMVWVLLIGLSFII